jgi:hypothetical protein
VTRGGHPGGRQLALPPRDTRALLALDSTDVSFAADTTIVVEGTGCEPLLTTALGELDFWFTPSAGGFMLVADHDDYATIFAPRQGAVSRVSERPRLAGFREVPGYRRIL